MLGESRRGSAGQGDKPWDWAAGEGSVRIMVRNMGYRTIIMATLAGLGCLAATAALPLHGQEETCDEALLGRVQEAYQAIDGFSGRFEQVDHQADGKSAMAEGKIAYRKPGRMRWDYDPPHEQLVVTDGETVWLFDPLLDNVTVQPLAEVTQGTPLAFLLGVGVLTEDFRCRAHTRPPPEDGLTYLELVPREKIPTLAFIQIGVRFVSAALQSLLMIDTQDNLRMVRLQNLRHGTNFPADHLAFTVTGDMEVITK